MRVAFVIPSLGASSLDSCLEAVKAQSLPADEVILVFSGEGIPPRLPEDVRLLRRSRRLGFAAAVNRGLEALGESIEAVALLNDDAIPEPGWLEAMIRVLSEDPESGAVQGIVLDSGGEKIDGAGLALDPFGLPIQLDHGMQFSGEKYELRTIPGVSATAALFRRSAIDEVRLPDGMIFDERFDSYGEDVDLALRLSRLRWKGRLEGDAICRHLGSETGRGLRWRHPWWILSNRWRALASNFCPGALFRRLPSLLRGEIRAIRSLGRKNPVAWLVAPVVFISLPWILLRSFLRSSPGPRFRRLEDFSL